MSRFDESKFIEIDIPTLHKRCNVLADMCIENGDILPPAFWFEKDAIDGFRTFDIQMGIGGRITRLNRRIWLIIRNGARLPRSLPKLFAVRCMALLAAHQLHLSFLNRYDSTKNILMADDDDQAFYWAVTAFWRYSGYDDHANIWKKERERLMFVHDISLLNDKWQRGKTGKELMLEQAQRKEREAHQEWEQSMQAVKRLKN